jgi:alpha-mannosidase
MNNVKIVVFCLLFVIILSPPFYGQEDIQKHLRAIESEINNQIFSWTVLKQKISFDRITDTQDSEWEPLRPGTTIRDKNFWIRYEFQTPEIFAGIKTQGSPVTINCRFRGIGFVKGKLYLNQDLSKSFDLEFGNHSTEIIKDFLITNNSKPGEKISVILQFDNLGKVPLIERRSAEPGAYLQLREALFQIQNSREAHNLLSQFLLDVKIASTLLDLDPRRTLAPEKARPISDEYKKSDSSRSMKNLRERFKKAFLNFDLDVLRRGDLDAVKKSLMRFYLDVRPVSLFAKSYTIYLGGNSHIDLAWLWRWQETVEVAKETFSTIMNNMEEYEDIIFIQSQAQAYQWMEEYYPDVFRRIQKKVKEGRWELIGGLWAEPDCNLIDGESFIRQILYGKRYFMEKFGVDIKIGWNPDSFGYNWNMPQFFKKSGVDSFVTQKISWNDTTVFPYFLFWWEGVDGSKLLTYFPPTGYVGRIQAENITMGIKQFEKNTGLKDTYILYGLGNHGGGPNREMLNRSLSYKKQMIFPEIKHSTFSSFIDRIRKGGLKAVPTWKDELYLEYHRGTYTTQAETKRFNRESEVLLSNTEKISSLAFLLGSEYDQKSLKSSWEKVLMNQFHDILPGSSINPVYKDSRESYLEAHRTAKKELQKNLNHLASQINTQVGPEGKPLIIFNTLSWKRDGLAQVFLPSNSENISVADDSGQKIPFQLQKTENGTLLSFIARKIPALGYRVFKIQKSSSAPFRSGVSVEANALENQFFRITLHPESGNIVSIFDKLAKREVLASSAQGNQLQLLEDIPDRWDAWNIQYTGREWLLDKADSISIKKKGPVMASIQVDKSYLGLAKAKREPTTEFPSSFFSQEIILYDGIPRIDIKMKADWWEEHVLLKVAFPVDINNDSATYEIPFASIQRPTTRNTPWEKARFEVPAIRWADLSSRDYGVSLLNDSKYGHDIKDNVMRLTLLRSPLSPDPMADRGKHEFAYSLYPHKGDWKDADTVQKGYEFNVPLFAFFEDPHDGQLPPASSFFKAEPSNIIVVTVKKAEDRDSIVLRLYESEGQETEASISFFQKPKRIYELDLMEKRSRSLSTRDGMLRLEFGRSEIKTVELVY